METIRRIIAQLRAIWQKMSRTQRLVAVGVGVLTMAFLLGFAYLAGHREYRVLYSNLPVEEVGAITSKLQTRGIPYRLEAGGTTITVPEDRLAQARVDLAGEGLPAGGGKGFELFDESSLAATPFVQNVNYLRALQAELARSIAQLDPVVSARVHIVRPEQTPFVRDQKPTTASVVLKLRSGARLDRSTAESITALVARAVEGLTPENVAVVDTHGRLLSDPRPSEDKVAGSQLEYRRELENYLASKAED